jgi:pyrroline-5-carboxylate reductase
MKMKYKISIIGCGNIGSAMAQGFVKSKSVDPKNIILTTRKHQNLHHFQSSGFVITSDNCEAVKRSEFVIIAVAPAQIVSVLKEINSSLQDNQILISVVSGVDIAQMRKHISSQIPIIRAMPNTAATLCESMTCITGGNEEEISACEKLFNLIGTTIRIDEDKMASATALGACGIAFFLRAIRAASQGGIEIGFHSDEAFIIASQTARGAATLLLQNNNHPESEIDKVTTPQGATISGLNEMEHQGFSSAMIRGITTSTNKISRLFQKD